MKKITNWAWIVICSVFVITTIYLFNKVHVINDKLDTLAVYNQKLQKKIPIQAENLLLSQFKEEAYIRQQERDTTIILVVFGAMTAIFAFFTFKGVKLEFEEETKKIKNEYEDFKTNIQNKYDKNEQELIKVKSDLYNQLMMFTYQNSVTALNNRDLVSYFILTLYYFKYAVYTYHNCDEFTKNDIVENLIIDIEQFNNKLLHLEEIAYDSTEDIDEICIIIYDFLKDKPKQLRQYSQIIEKIIKRDNKTGQ